MWFVFGLIIALVFAAYMAWMLAPVENHRVSQRRLRTKRDKHGWRGGPQ